MNENVKQTQENAYKLWEEHVSTGYLLYPNEYLTRYIFANRKSFKTVLDFGCGDGRHLEMMSKAKIPNIIGVDINQKPLEVAFTRLNERVERVGKLILLNNKNKSLKDIIGDTKVDAILSWGVLHLFTPNIVVNLLSEFKNHLNKNGKILVNFRSQNDSLKNSAINLEPNVYKATRKSHKDLLYTFYTIDMIKDVFQKADLKISSIDKETFSQNNGDIQNEFYITEAIHNS
ncbi:class I SAM-dependent methyltransferase [Campylobacter hyointestinalis]|uniref:class I SAM-dependent methyltransferase n=1 Tax=Campylobacter hyointestinalis TaxID=198 RepID=UPI00072B1472|nr:class I SAM-dependent methyltransferase [Campylobacter hyointestinalis]CUU82421.1 tRNA mo(5)U34 methyltransferase [Campylobacter hyointestinalis subsp. hyointestinalis]